MIDRIAHGNETASVNTAPRTVLRWATCCYAYIDIYFLHNNVWVFAPFLRIPFPNLAVSSEEDEVEDEEGGEEETEMTQGDGRASKRRRQ